MLFYTVGQSRVFLMMVYVGLGIGAWYGLLDRLRRLTGAGPWLSLALDACFGAGAAALIILGAMRASRGELRLYALLGALCGLFLERGLAAPVRRALGRHAGKLAHAFRARPHPLLQRLLR